MLKSFGDRMHGLPYQHCSCKRSLCIDEKKNIKIPLLISLCPGVYDKYKKSLPSGIDMQQEVQIKGSVERSSLP